METFDSIEDYVQKLGGKRVIKKILIANNGLAAVKGIRSMRKWAHDTFKKENELTFIVMATSDDIRANSEYIRLGDEIVEVEGGSTRNNYSNIKLIVNIAEDFEADAVWAGWGHASENPLLPDSLQKLKKPIAFIGPNGHSMRMLGDKISSSIIAENAQVPTIKWSGTGIKIKGCEISKETYEKACVKSEEEAIESAKEIGYPLMVLF
jgi:acetyl-CoA carboxylase/biotin carboxylase 1